MLELRENSKRSKYLTHGSEIKAGEKVFRIRSTAGTVEVSPAMCGFVVTW